MTVSIPANTIVSVQPSVLAAGGLGPLKSIVALRDLNDGVDAPRFPAVHHLCGLDPDAQHKKGRTEQGRQGRH